MRSLTLFILIAVVGVAPGGVWASDATDLDAEAAAQLKKYPPLPHVRPGGVPYNPDQPLHPYAVRAPLGPRDVPLAGFVDSPPEYTPTRGVLFTYIQGHWNSVVTDLVVNLTNNPEVDDIAYVVCPNSYHQGQAESAFLAGGADMSKVHFIVEPANAIWMRDYGPHFIWQDDALALVDSNYGSWRPLDDFVPTLVGDDHLVMPTYDMNLHYAGGNFQPGPVLDEKRTGFVTSLVVSDNPTYQGFTEEFIAELYQTYQGIDELHILPQLPSSVDATGHIDMWMYIVDEDDVIISKFKEGSHPTAIEITDNAVPYMEALGFTVHRTWAWNQGSTHFTFTNAFRCGDRIFMPQYSGFAAESADALAQYQAAAGPEVEIIQIECTSIIPAFGALHCICMQVPRRVETAPAVHVVGPCGGELLACGNTCTIAWAATDQDNAEIPTVDLYYSIDDGANWEHIATTTDTGFYEWTVPDLRTDLARIKVVATAADADTGEGVSAEAFRIAPADQTVYDFASGAGEDKYGYGYQVSSWTSIDGNRQPVDQEIETLVAGAYGALAASDATGGDSDTHRYISPTTSTRSTHIFEFSIEEDPAEIDDIGILWEGYGDRCTNIELYVWDYVEEQWGDCQGMYGQNRFLDGWGGNRDGYLAGHIQADLDRYIDADGQMTLLVYDENYSDETFHDYLSVTVTTVKPVLTGAWSCRDHDAAGEFCLEVMPGRAVEPRLGGVERLEFDCALGVTTFAAGVECEFAGYSGTATPYADGGTSIAVEFDPALPADDCCTITLTGDVESVYAIATLEGDLDQNLIVNSIDASSIKPRFGQSTDEDNFVYDVNGDGLVSSLDYSAIKPRFGHQMESCP